MDCNGREEAESGRLDRGRHISAQRRDRRKGPVAPEGAAWYLPTMAEKPAEKPTEASPTPAARRIVEVVYGVEGVVAARVWHAPGKVVVGVRGGRDTSPDELLARVERAVVGLKDPGVTWDFGWLEEP